MTRATEETYLELTASWKPLKIQNTLRRGRMASYQIPQTEILDPLGAKSFRADYWGKHGQERLYIKDENGREAGYISIDEDGKLYPNGEGNRPFLRMAAVVILTDPRNAKKVAQ